jgi:Flp pilus assembly protein TadD
MGICYRELGRLDEAEESFRKAIAIKPRQREYHMNLARVLYMKGDYRRAVETLDAVLGMYPDFTQARFDLAQNYLALRMPGEAVREMSEAIKQVPESYEARYNLAVIYASIGERDKARREAALALSLAAGEEQMRDARNILEEK